MTLFVYIDSLQGYVCIELESADAVQIPPLVSSLKRAEQDFGSAQKSTINDDLRISMTKFNSKIHSYAGKEYSLSLEGLTADET